jgi:hypothetical protein
MIFRRFSILAVNGIVRRMPKKSTLQSLSTNWHVANVTIPRRSIAGRLVHGQVWRRFDGRRWIYKKYTGN